MMMIDFSSIGVFILATTTINTKFSPQTYPSYYESRILPITETWGSFFPHLYFVFGTNKFDYHFLSTRCTEENNPIQKRKQADTVLSPFQGNVSEYKQKKLKKSQILSANNVKEKLQAILKDHQQLRRKLVPHTPQMKLQEKSILYDCHPDLGEGKWREFPQNHSSRHFFPSAVSNPNNATTTIPYLPEYYSYLTSLQHRNNPWKALYVGNCTGEYFGAGPTCRCQETIRYFLLNKDHRFSKMKWFIFMDDDIYLRPYSIQKFLSVAWTKLEAESNPVVFISSDIGHELRNAKHKKYQNYTSSCNQLFQDSFHLAQPAIMNRIALEVMRPSIEANAHMRLQQIWGGSHDVILGLLLWLYALPVYSFSKIYLGVSLNTSPNYVQRSERLQYQYFIFHKVLNFIAYKFNKKTKNYEAKYTIASQYYISTLIEDDYLYDSYKGLTLQKFKDLIQEQQNMGIKGIENVHLLQQSTIPFTKYYSNYGKILSQNYTMDFEPSDCNQRNR